MQANYYFIDNKAYTEDDLLVYNVYAYQIPKKVTPDESWQYFSQFGELLSVRLLEDNNNGDAKRKSVGKAENNDNNKVAFVHFADPIAAAKALQRSNHVLQKKRFFVKACDSWDQPEAQKGGGIDVSATIANVLTVDFDLIDLSDDLNIMHLNDDCLEHICRLLPLRDQVHFARACKRFRNIFELCCHCEHKVFEMNKLIGMTLWDIRDFFELAGYNIERMIGSVPYNYQDRIEFIGDLCPHVKSIDFNCNNMESTSLLKLLQKMRTITDLQLHNFALNDSAVLALTNLPNLKILRLRWSFELTGKNLNKLYDLQELSLYGCENLQTVHFLEICTSLSSLKTLDIRHCMMLTSSAYKEMNRYCRVLETLKISCQKDVRYEYVTRLPALRRLEVHSFAGVRDQLFIDLADYMPAQLEYLEILARNCILLENAIRLRQLTRLKTLVCPFNDSLDDACLSELAELKQLQVLDIKGCRSITNAGLLKLLHKCAQLQRLNVERCENINDDFIYETAQYLERYQPLRDVPLWIDVFETSVNERVLGSPKLEYTEKLLKISFRNTRRE